MVRYRFSNTWFESQTEWIWNDKLKDVEVASYLEIGVNEGRSLIWMLENHPELKRAVGVDPYIAPKRLDQKRFAEYEQNLHYNLASGGFSDAVELVKQRSLDYLMDAYKAGRRHEFDLVYVDGDHSAPFCMMDMLLAWPLLKPGGLMVVDDLNRNYSNGRPQVRVAKRAFDTVLDGRYWPMWEIKRQCCYKKAKDY